MTSSTANTDRSWLAERLGPLGAQRVPAGWGRSIAGGGGVILAAGVAFIVAPDAAGGIGGRGAALVTGLLLAAGGLGVAAIRPGPLRSAGIAAATVGIAVAAVAATSSFVFAPSAIGAVLAAVAYLGAYLVGPWRGHGLLLGAGLVALWLALVIGVAATGATIGGEVPATAPPSSVVPYAAPNTAAGLLWFTLGVVYIAIGWALDRARLAGVATPFIAVGDVVVITGLGTTAPLMGAIGTSMLAILVGTGMGAVGAVGGRRATTWLGGFVTVVGVLALVGQLVPDAGPRPAGGILIAIGAGLVVGAAVVARVLGEPDPVAAGDVVLTDPPPVTFPSPDDPPPPPAAPTPPPPPTA